MSELFESKWGETKAALTENPTKQEALNREGVAVAHSKYSLWIELSFTRNIKPSLHVEILAVSTLNP